MKSISTIFEGRNRTAHDSVSLFSHEVADYAKSNAKKLPKEVSAVIYFLQKYNITSREQIDEIKTASGSKQKKLAETLGVNVENLIELKTMLINLGSNINLLPMYMSKDQRSRFTAGSLSAEDITLDLTTDKGRNKVAKQYGALAFKIVDQFVGKENLDKAELLSAALYGLTYAMDTYRQNDIPSTGDELADSEIKKAKGQTFGQYAAYMMRYKILEEIYANSRTIKMGYGARKKAYANGETTNLTTSLDATFNDDDDSDEKGGDHNAALAVNDKPSGNEEEKWNKVFARLEAKFSKRDILIFMKYFGVNGMKKEKGKDIAAEFNVSPATVTHTISKKIIPFLKNDKEAMEILAELSDMYNESLVVELLGKTAQEIREQLLADDVYLLLEELNKWKTPKELSYALYNTMEMMTADYEPVFMLLDADYDTIDANYRKNIKGIKEFLSLMYPTESFNRKSDVYVLDKFYEIAQLVQKWGLDKKV